MLIASGVKMMESQLLWEFIAFLKARWSARSRVDQRRRRLRQLVAMVRAVADAAECRAAVRDGSLSAWLHVLRAEALRGQKVLEAPGCDAAAVAVRTELVILSAGRWSSDFSLVLILHFFRSES
ncbi:uncharacterized protein C2845_PM07G00760 [Panicum miliaceum]|uniref:Uncharacterized protein n=1 Tax=Panicum miliaceum TaxID=4540 RepID=A0A3L6SRS0_PANMI|nr:uncharacterized protein C2845_PM07G00760 [Panicum miliaceum]